tara:strand:+ start:294 stop:698 length:405 start_codon:yes stop_codon:yes gene_type:complete
MSNLKENLLKVIDSALELAAECEQTIEVRGAVKQLKQAHGSISMHTEETLIASRKVQALPDQTPEEAKSDIAEAVSEGLMDATENDDLVPLGSTTPLPEDEIDEQFAKNVEVNDAQEIHGEKAPESDLDLTDPA